MKIKNGKATIKESSMKLVLNDALRYRFLRDILPMQSKNIDNCDLEIKGIQVVMFCEGNGSAIQIDGIDLDEEIDLCLSKLLFGEKND
jgi:hypothetical protein